MGNQVDGGGQIQLETEIQKYLKAKTGQHLAKFIYKDHGRQQTKLPNQQRKPTGRKNRLPLLSSPKEARVGKCNANFLSRSFCPGLFHISFRHMYRSTSQTVTTVQCLVSLGSRTGRGIVHSLGAENSADTPLVELRGRSL